jgi:D-alanine-D-alanine ligase
MNGLVNNMSAGKVAVLMGGSSAEREISLMSGAAVLKALQSQGINAYAFDPSQQDMIDLKREGFTAAHIALHGRYGEDGTVQGALELLGIPYTGSGVMASSLAIDKAMTKRIWLAQGLPTPSFVALKRGEYTRQEAMTVPDTVGLPLIVKPAREGSSLGVKKVAGYSQVVKAIEAAGQLDRDILCEQCIEGDEVTCAVLEIDGKAKALPLIRIAAPGGDYDFQNKYFTDTVQYHVPSGLPLAEEQHIQDLTLRAFAALGCRGWARADVMIDAKTRQPYLLEINTSPGMTSHSLVPMAAKAIGLSFEQLCLHILQSARLDYASKQDQAGQA